MQHFVRLRELVGRRYWFAAVYALIAIATGWLNGMAMDATVVNALQLAILGALGLLTGGSGLSSILAGTDLWIALALAVCGVGPLIQICLAVIRGRRIDRRFLVVFPILGTAVSLISTFPFSGLDTGTAIWGPSVVTKDDCYCLCVWFEHADWANDETSLIRPANRSRFP
jgi:hypothetical protein